MMDVIQLLEEGECWKGSSSCCLIEDVDILDNIFGTEY